MTPVVTRIEPAGVVLVDGSPADYVDVFTVTGLAHVPRPRDAATRLLAGAMRGGGVFALAVWRGALGLQVAPSRSGTVAGWTVVADDAELLDLVATGGRRMQGRMLFESTASGLTWTTALRFGHPVAAPTWRALGPVHRALVPRLLAELPG
ncbi:hypothetical protein [Nocardioides mangrovi]|uniref:DUF1990 domain-containing protein n=1 Tax=Nocardioides mangrovi TaxID=2874580 RepID=A0ABS7UFD3_9ACTN|nr:hypothetical protein [Nocardioides mangrovi]MBZ5739705.1 hypothetical protein [Nocardioides mangrovi]